jgi:hypothetical protein
MPKINYYLFHFQAVLEHLYHYLSGNGIYTQVNLSEKFVISAVETIAIVNDFF